MGWASNLGNAVKAHVISAAKELGNHLLDRIDPKTIAAEVAETATTRIIPHGSAELAHALMTQNSGYVPYGQESIPVAEAEAASAEQYQANLALYGQRSGQTNDQTLSL